MNNELIENKINYELGISNVIHYYNINLLKKYYYQLNILLLKKKNYLYFLLNTLDKLYLFKLINYIENNHNNFFKLLKLKKKKIDIINYLTNYIYNKFTIYNFSKIFNNNEIIIIFNNFNYLINNI